jgi:hypothetical protein
MADGFIASGIGVVSAFGVLFILMLFTRLITRTLPRGHFRKDVGDIAGCEVAVREPGEEADIEATGPAAPMSAPGNLLQSPDSAAEVAAIALAIAAHLRKQGRDLTGWPLVIEDVQYEVKVGDHSHSPVDVIVNGETFAASLDGKGLPVERGAPPARTVRLGDEQRGRAWRSACPVPQGGHWDRRGWSRSR